MNWVVLMAKQIARLLKTDIMADLDLPGLAQLLESKGRKGDTMLAHITPQEAALLKARGGAGTTNPDTGLPEFYDLMQYAGDPDITTGGYRTAPQMSYAPAEVEYGFGSPSTFEYEPRFQETPQSKQLVRDIVASTPIEYGNVSDAEDAGTFRGLSLDTRTPVQRALGARTQGLQIAPSTGMGELAASAVPSGRPGVYTPSAEVQAALDRRPSLGERLKARITSPEGLEQIGLTGLQTLPAILMAQQAAAQGRRSREEMQRLAAPYQQQGQALVQQAQRGELTAPAQQQIQALQARAAQGVAGRGGVGAEQAAAQVEAFRQQLLQGQYDMGLKVANIGDQIAAGAIRTGLSADQYVNELTNNYFTNVARMSYGQAPQTVAATQPVRA